MFGECFTCGCPHLKNKCPFQVKVNSLLDAKLERKKNNEAGTSNVNSLGWLKMKMMGRT